MFTQSSMGYTVSKTIESISLLSAARTLSTVTRAGSAPPMNFESTGVSAAIFATAKNGDPGKLGSVSDLLHVIVTPPTARDTFIFSKTG